MNDSTSASASQGYIISPTYRGPDRRKRPYQLNPASLLDHDRRESDAPSLWSMYVDARDREADEQ